MSRRKAVRRVLGRHAALERMPREGNRVLRRHTGSGIADLCPAGDPQLRLDNVDSRDCLGDGVLDLQTRIEFDEVERLRVSVEEKLDGPGLGVVGGTRQRERRVAEPPALGLGQIRRRRPLDHLLMASLDGTIPLEQMDHVAAQIAEDLDFDVAYPAHELFEIHLVVAEGAAGFASRLLDECRELGG